VPAPLRDVMAQLSELGLSVAEGVARLALDVNATAIVAFAVLTKVLSGNK
jgi:hypothetical protein